MKIITLRRDLRLQGQVVNLYLFAINLHIVFLNEQESLYSQRMQLKMNCHYWFF